MEILRTMHLPDTCIACAELMLDPEGNDVATVNVSKS